jgi:hypothetical protein
LLPFLYQIFSLWTISDRKYGGLGFSSKDVGQVLAVSGITLLVTLMVTCTFLMILSICGLKFNHGVINIPQYQDYLGCTFFSIIGFYYL